MIDRKALLTDLKKQVGALEGDLRERAADDADIHARLYGEWQQARTASRIAASYESWLDDRVTQAAVAWVLGTVFLRFCEDNGLIEMPFLAGPGERLDLAQERQAEYIRGNPHDTDRDWILAGFAEMSRSPVAAGLFDRAHNPMWQIEIPHHAAKALLGFWRRRDEDGGIVHDFTDPEWDTRFLGDLYQDLSEHAKKTYALLQTPEFVEEFILDYTLEPAVDEFGLAGLRLIDPTCGSGHFLLGAFHRILNKWRDAEPATDIWELIRRTLLSVHGVDKNPFATNIARFRLLVAMMKVSSVSRLVRVPEFPIIVATGDSLLHGRGGPGVQGDLLSSPEAHTFATEDIYEYISDQDEVGSEVADLLGVGSYHAVVGNPPYIDVDDQVERDTYRSAYLSCYKGYPLSVPFVERFFQLAVRGNSSVGGRAGYIGQITANSFMRREFGKKLITDFLPSLDLTHVIDTAGLTQSLEGHPTPTVILFGRRRWPVSSKVRVVVGLRGESADSPRYAKSPLWVSLVQHAISEGELSDFWVGASDLSREILGRHPWSLGSGSGHELVNRIRESSDLTIKDKAQRLGFYGDTHADEAFFLPCPSPRHIANRNLFARLAHRGNQLRDWRYTSADRMIMPYDGEKKLLAEEEISDDLLRFLWPLRTELGMRSAFGGGTYASSGRPWWSWHQLPRDEKLHPWAISYAEVATHNHFVLEREAIVFNRTAPVLKFNKDIDEETLLGIVGYLNSSTACFLLRETCQKKGGGAGGGREGGKRWAWTYGFNASNVGRLPIPHSLPHDLARALDQLASEMMTLTPERICASQVPSHPLLASARRNYREVKEKMVALQEELDWTVYCILGIAPKELEYTNVDGIPGIRPGERAFEILMAQEIGNSDDSSGWFAAHKIDRVDAVLAEWPESYRRTVEARISFIRDHPQIQLLERPESKRRWEVRPGESWDEMESVALKTWLLDRCESHLLWFTHDEYGNQQPAVMTVNHIADRLRRDGEFLSVARLYAGDDVELADVIADITCSEHAPYLAAFRYRDPSGMRKWEQWQAVWRQQREEDRANKLLDIPVPAKFVAANFWESSYYRNRGKFDVPKERFISYPCGGPDGDSSLLLGWAGWNHREQAQALMMLIEERATQDGWDAARLTPLLAGLAEVLPWVRQWHGEIDPAFGQSPADAYAMYLEDKQRTYGISDEDLKNWRPEKPTRGGRRKKTS